MITILTPTYNRAHTLQRLFQSLEAQTSKSFDWLVVDDGSTDQTRALIADCAKSAGFAVTYVWQNNGGKHTALNTGVQMASSEWVLIVDSDDALVPNAIECISAHLKQYSSASLVGLAYRRVFFNGALVGRPGDCDEALCLHPSEAGRRFKGDLAYLFRVDSFRRNLFPVVEGEKFVPELYVWNRLGDQGRILYFPRIAIYQCEYMTDGYTANFRNNLRSNPSGFGLFYRDQFRREPLGIQKLKCAIRAAQCFWYQTMRRRRA